MWALQGVAFVCVTATVTIGLAKSLSVKPTARYIARAAVRFIQASVPGKSPVTSAERPRDGFGTSSTQLLVVCRDIEREPPIAALEARVGSTGPRPKASWDEGAIVMQVCEMMV